MDYVKNEIMTNSFTVYKRESERASERKIFQSSAYDFFGRLKEMRGSRGGLF